MRLTAEGVKMAWKRQLLTKAMPYVEVALQQEHAVRVVLYVGTDGEVREPEISTKPGRSPNLNLTDF